MDKDIVFTVRLSRPNSTATKVSGFESCPKILKVIDVKCYLATFLTWNKFVSSYLLALSSSVLEFAVCEVFAILLKQKRFNQIEYNRFYQIYWKVWTDLNIFTALYQTRYHIAWINVYYFLIKKKRNVLIFWIKRFKICFSIWKKNETKSICIFSLFA